MANSIKWFSSLIKLISIQSVCLDAYTIIMVIFAFFLFTIHYIIINCNINNVLLVYCTVVSSVILASFTLLSLRTSSRFAFYSPIM